MEIFDVFSMNRIENYPAAGKHFLENVILKGGVQAYNFGNFNYEIRVEGEGQDTSRRF